MSMCSIICIYIICYLYLFSSSSYSSEIGKEMGKKINKNSKSMEWQRDSERIRCFVTKQRTINKLLFILGQKFRFENFSERSY